MWDQCPPSTKSPLTNAPVQCRRSSWPSDRGRTSPCRLSARQARSRRQRSPPDRQRQYPNLRALGYETPLPGSAMARSPCLSHSRSPEIRPGQLRRPRVGQEFEVPTPPASGRWRGARGSTERPESQRLRPRPTRSLIAATSLTWSSSPAQHDETPPDNDLGKRLPRTGGGVATLRMQLLRLADRSAI
jgi:hypothetical protein